LPDVAKYSGFNYIGNVSIGNKPDQLPLPLLASQYDAVLFAYGASKDKELGISGESLNGIISARAFVGWYNGLPEYAHLNPNLEAGETAVVIGQGNVALDVTRILLKPLEQLRKTDIAEHALEALSKSKVRDVKVIGRRGPLQAPYTIKELRELMNIPGLAFAPPPSGWDGLIQVERKALPRQLSRIVEVLTKGSKTQLADASRAWQLGYLRSPSEFLSTNGKDLAAVGFEATEYRTSTDSVLTDDAQTNLNAIRNIGVKGTGSKTIVGASLAFRSVGYKSEALDGMDQLGIVFDQKAGILPNDRWGRVLSPDLGPAGSLTAGHIPGMYCAGWVKRGPTGVIASTLDDAFATADVIVQDWRDRAVFHTGVGPEKRGWDALRSEVKSKAIRSVSWQDWEKIDAAEVQRGQAVGRERVKFRTVEEMLQVLD
jgi:adrenodoxin-NADP+ reductase